MGGKEYQLAWGWQGNAHEPATTRRHFSMAAQLTRISMHAVDRGQWIRRVSSMSSHAIFFVSAPPAVLLSLIEGATLI